MEKYSDTLRKVADALDKDFDDNLRPAWLELNRLVSDMSLVLVRNISRSEAILVAQVVEQKKRAAARHAEVEAARERADGEESEEAEEAQEEAEGEAPPEDQDAETDAGSGSEGVHLHGDDEEPGEAPTE